MTNPQPTPDPAVTLLRWWNRGMWVLLAGTLATAAFISTTKPSDPTPAEREKQYQEWAKANGVDADGNISPQKVVDRHELKMRWGCEKAIKAQLRDPGSYEVEKVIYVPSEAEEAPGQVVDTRISFRARNGFGGMNTMFARCGHDSAGELVRQPNPVNGY